MKVSDYLASLRVAGRSDVQMNTRHGVGVSATKRKRGYLIVCAYFLTCSYVIASELGEEADFFEFLADFYDDEEWIDPLEIEAWGDRRLAKPRPEPRPEPNQELEENKVLESIYEHHHSLDQTPVMDTTDDAADEESYDEN